MQKEDMIKELNNIPAEIQTLSKELLDIENRLQSIKINQELLVSDEKLDISVAVDDNGKKIFTNQDQRDAELSRRLSGNAGYKMTDEKVQSIQKDIALKKIDINFLRDRLSVLKTITQLLSYETE